MSSAIPTLRTGPDVAPTTADRIGSNQLGKQEFLKLLMAQLANQDPTAPTDSTAFIGQLAQFAGLEAVQGTNSRLDTLLMAQASSNQTAVVSFIGKEVNYRTDGLNLQAGLSASSQVHLAGKAETISVAVMDANGRTVRTIKLGAHDAGNLSITWDGLDDGGNRQPPGVYKMQAVATDRDGKSVDVELRGSGMVQGVAFENGIPQLSVNGTLINLSEVTSINQRSPL
jgi:flagellar basal-body rod modification protein FlgD